MRMTNSNMRSTAVAALLSLPVATGTALAQQSQDTGQTQQSTQQSQATAQQQSSQSATGQAASGQQADTVVATVGGAEIRGSDVMTVIGMLPPQLQSQPPQMLVPIALQQLILRELILEEARSQNLAQDPEVRSLVESSTQTAEEDAMVQVWVDRQMANAVTDEAVQQVYEGLQAQGQQELPPVEQLRPQIEQHLRQQAMQDIQTRLQEGADIVLFDPSGQPIQQKQGNGGTQQQGQGSQQDSGGATADSASGGQSGGSEASGGNSGGQSSEGSSGSSGTSGEQTQNN